MDPASFPGGVKPTLEEFKKGLERMDPYALDRPLIGRHLICEQPAALGTTRVEGLLPGKVDVSVELGEPMGRVLRAARASVELVAGETAQVTLSLKSAQFPKLVPLAGTLRVPAAWPTQDARLEISATDLVGASNRDRARLPLNYMPSVPGDPQTLCFDLGAMPSATYRFTVESLAFERLVRIAESGSDHVALEVPEAATLYLTVVDSASGRPVDVKGVAWRPGTGAWSLVAPAIGFHPVDAGARLAATLPVGEGKFALALAGEWRLDPPASTVIHAGEQEFTLRVHHANGLRLKLECSGAAVEWKEEMPIGVKFESVDGDGVVTFVTGSKGSALFVVSRPGAYLVTIPAIAGYADVEPFEIAIPAGEFVEKTVELHRR
jgi:hypothetical protein